VKQDGWQFSPATVIALLAACFASRALATTDPFLLLSSPSLVSNQVQFTLTGESGVPYVIESSEDLQNWATIATITNSTIARLITLDAPNNPTFYRAWRRLLPVFAAAVATKNGIDFKGQNVRVDSYDSADPNYSTNGLYDPNHPKAGGDIASESGPINVQNGDIKGKLLTGPSVPLPTLLNGEVGDLNWNTQGAIEPGWYRNDFRFVIPDVQPPFGSGYSVVKIGSTNIVGNGNYLFTGDLALNSGEVLLVSGNAKLYVTGNFTMKASGANSSAINIPGNASLKLYVGGQTTTLQQVNVNGNSFQFMCFGLTNNTSISWIGNAIYSGEVYAPEATLSFGSGGNSPMDFEGACVAQSIAINGHLSIHYDEDLKRTGPAR